MSSSSAHGDASVSAASFLASISADSSNIQGDSSISTATSAPVLPMSAKVSLIDAQIDALEVRIEQAITTQADQLRERATSTRSAGHDLAQLWRCINQTSIRPVTIGPQLAPIASEYHDALAQSSKQGLLISVLSDLLAATKHLEKLEKLQSLSDLSSLQIELRKAEQVMQPFRSRSALHSLPAVVELTARFERIETKCREASSVSSSAKPAQEASTSTARSSVDEGARHPKDTYTTQKPSPALHVLDAARALIVSRGADAGWKEVRIQLDSPAPPPPPPTLHPAADSKAPLPADSPSSSISGRPEHLLRDDKDVEPATLTRNSSSSSTTNARNKHKAKLGARLIRPQDQLGSGPFNAEDTPLDEDGWGLDDDDDNDGPTHPPLAVHAQHQPRFTSSISQQFSHESVTASPRDSHRSSPSASVIMQRGLSSSSSQRSSFAVQETEQGPSSLSASNDVDAWGLGEDDDAEADAWDLDADEDFQPPPVSPKRDEAHVTSPIDQNKSLASPTVPATQDAWGLEEEDINVDEDPWALPAEPVTAAPPTAASQVCDTVVLPTSDGAVSHLHGVAVQSPPPDAIPRVPTAGNASSSGPAQQHAVMVATNAPSQHAVEGSLRLYHDGVVSSQYDGVENRLHRSPGMEETSQPLHHTEEAGQGKEAPTEVPQQVTTPAVQEEEGGREGGQEENDPEEDAWGFEDGSSSSEADRAEVATSTAIRTFKASEGPASSSSHPTVDYDESNSSETPPMLFETDQETVAPQVQRVEPAEGTASPSGWRLDFSDSDSQGDAVPDPLNFSALSGPATRRDAADTTTPRAVDAGSKAIINETTANAAPLPAPLSEAPAILKEECSVSKRSLDLVKLADSTLSSVISLLHSETSQSHAKVDDAEALASAVCKIFELHRALMPVAHGKVLHDVPALAMQFFNDCEYLARELTRLVSDKGEAITAAWMSQDAEGAKRWKTKELIKMEHEAELTRGLGQRWFEAQMAAQSKILLDTLLEADGFARTFEEHRFARCERCVKQVEHTLQQLAKAWRPVLAASRFYAALGRLVDLVFQKVLHDVLDLEDIGESESEKIASLVKTLGNLESLFSAEGSEQSAAPLWVPSWFKTSYLIEILTGSLIDIEFLAFEAGALVDYSRGELTKLIKALFADTTNRSRLLRRIETASIDVLAR